MGEFSPYLATILTLVAIALAYYAGRRDGIEIGAVGMFDVLRDEGVIETAMEYQDGEEHEVIIKDGRPIRKNYSDS